MRPQPALVSAPVHSQHPLDAKTILFSNRRLIFSCLMRSAGDRSAKSPFVMTCSRILSCVFCIAIDWSTLKSPFCWLECCCLNSFQPFNEPSRLHQSTGEAFFVFPAATQDRCDLRFPQEALKINAAGIAFADLHAPRLLPSPMGARPERESFICSSHGSEPMGCRRGKDSERLCVSLVGARASDPQARCGRPQSRCRRL